MNGATEPQFSERAALDFVMFSGDRDVDITVFANKMVTTRKPHKCVICWEEIPSGTRVRAQTERDNDDKIVMTFYLCRHCCTAGALAYTQSDWTGEALSERYEIGIRNARAAA